MAARTTVTRNVYIREHSNLDKGLDLVQQIKELKDLTRAIKDAFAHRELEGGVKAAFSHPLYIQAQEKIDELEEQLTLLI